MRKHSGSEHPKSGRRPQWRQAAVQTFLQIHKLYFTVNPSLSQVAPSDPYFSFIHEYLPSLPAPSLPSATKPQDIPPLLHVTRWHSHLDKFYRDAKTRQYLKEMVALPKPDVGVYGALSGHVFRYLLRVRELGKTAAYLILRMILHYPLKETGEAWHCHENDDTLERYSKLLASFIYATLLSLGRHQSGYSLPLEPNQRDAARSLAQALSDGKSSVETEVHSLAFSLLGPSSEAVARDKWRCPLMCVIAVMALRNDGSWIAARQLTPELAQWTYLCQAVQLFEIYRVADTMGGLQRQVESFTLTYQHHCRLYLCEGVVTPYNSIRELQHFASSLAMTETSPPRISWDRSMEWVAVDGKRLELARLRAALQQGLQEAWNLMLALSDNHRIPFAIPANLVDKMSNSDAGYSWLNNAKFTTVEHPLIRHLLQKGDADRLFWTDGHGNNHWIIPTCLRILDQAAEINKLLSVLNHIIPGQPPRGTEFISARIRNGTRDRNVFLDHGRLWFATRYTKMSNRQEHNQFLPILCPPSLAEINQYYLIIIRPAETILGRVVHGADAAADYHNFLYVQRGI
ncbi:hypothetical protein JAAARDRAFT_143448 [Jaapia argillacea MUCL 33604]|uniref:Uncharacterized protein n=1 Tax=Jaapia argillacea MUCL 33604 TaxID=933084 RepID=A0A067P3Z1_9AGAM|nr:hypothetical protein JAAARDRAFT_143448 [Jaapia argillacea MUCL 33604]